MQAMRESIRCDRRPTRRGFTLMEALMAAGILLIVVVAVTSAITAGQQNAYEAHLRIAGTLAAEELMGRILASDYADLSDWNNTEPVGQMTDVGGSPFPGSFGAIGRAAEITPTEYIATSLSVTVRGQTARVWTFDADGIVLAEIEHFIPEPAGLTVPADVSELIDDLLDVMDGLSPALLY